MSESEHTKSPRDAVRRQRPAEPAPRDGGRQEALPFGPEFLLMLQRTVGNQEVNNLLRQYRAARTTAVPSPLTNPPHVGQMTIQRDQDDPAQSVDPNVGSNQSVDPNAGSTQSVDPNAPNAGPNQSVDPNAGPTQSTDPNAGSSQSTDPNAGSSQSTDPSAGQNQSTDPNAGQDPSAGSGASSLDDAYNAAVQGGNWPDAAEKLNGFNREDILSRLARLTPDQVAQIHQGALDNPRVGPGSQVAQLTTSAASPDPSAALAAAAAPGALAAIMPGGIVPTTPGAPGIPDPTGIPGGPGDFPKIPGEPFPNGPTGPGAPSVPEPPPAPSPPSVPELPSTPSPPTVPEPVAPAVAGGAGGIGLGATIAIGVAAFATGLVAPFVIGYAIEHAAETSQQPDPDDPNTSDHGVGGAPPQTAAGTDGDAGAPLQAPSGQTPAPAIDPNTGLPLSAPANQNQAPAIDPAADDPAVLPGQPNAGPVQASSASIANGHAYQKHVIDKGEFPEIAKPTADRAAGIGEFQKIIDRVMGSAENKSLNAGRHAYWEDATGTLVLTNPADPDGGTCFRPIAGKKYYDDLK